MSLTGGKGRTFWGAAIAVVALDVVTKLLVERSLQLHVPKRVLGDVVRLTLAYNPGAAFSMTLGPASRWLFGALAVAALVVLWNLYRRAGAQEGAKVLALGLAWGGAAGNLIDRVRSAQGVVDFIDIGVRNIRFWTFNVADSGVTVGAVMLGVILMREDREQQRQQQQQRPAGE